MSEKTILIIVRYGEIAVKSKNVRVRMEKKLIENIRKQLSKEGLICNRIYREWGRIYIEVPEGVDVEKYVSTLSRVYGVSSSSPCIKARLDLEDIKKKVLEIASKTLKCNDTFAIRVRRANKLFPLTSKELERILGEEVLDKISCVKVDLENPKTTIGVEVRLKNALIYTREIEGPGGLPYGVEGRVLALLSGGLDSALATWMIMKRGCSIAILHYNLKPFYGDDVIDKLASIIEWLKKWVPEDKLTYYEAPLGEIHASIDMPDKYRCLFCKMLMYKVAEQIVFNKEFRGFVTGESIGQVASQTLDNLSVISRNINTLVLRPLIGFDKDDITKLAIRIGLYKIASKRVSECSLNPRSRGKKVITHATLKTINRIYKILKESTGMDFNDIVNSLLDKVVEKKI